MTPCATNWRWCTTICRATYAWGRCRPGAKIITDDWAGYYGLTKRGFNHLAVAERGDYRVAEEYRPIVHLVFSNLKTWLNGTHHGESHQHLQAYLNEFSFRFNRRFYPFNAFRSLLGSRRYLRSDLRRALLKIMGAP